LVPSVGLCELALEDGGDGVDGEVAEGVARGEPELVKDTGGEEICGGVSVATDEQVERGAHPAGAESDAIEEQAAVEGKPLQGDG
jgi:hypothetical protein